MSEQQQSPSSPAQQQQQQQQQPQQPQQLLTQQQGNAASSSTFIYHSADLSNGYPAQNQGQDQGQHQQAQPQNFVVHQQGQVFIHQFHPLQQLPLHQQQQILNQHMVFVPHNPQDYPDFQGYPPHHHQQQQQQPHPTQIQPHQSQQPQKQPQGQGQRRHRTEQQHQHQHQHQQEKDRKAGGEKVVDQKVLDSIRTQVEHYFSDENIVKDVFILKHMKKNKGFLPVKLLPTFPRIKKLSRNLDVIREALRASSALHVNKKGWGVRRRSPIPPIDPEIQEKAQFFQRPKNHDQHHQQHYQQQHYQHDYDNDHNDDHYDKAKKQWKKEKKRTEQKRPLYTSLDVIARDLDGTVERAWGRGRPLRAANSNSQGQGQEEKGEKSGAEADPAAAAATEFVLHFDWCVHLTHPVKWEGREFKKLEFHNFYEDFKLGQSRCRSGDAVVVSAGVAVYPNGQFHLIACEVRYKPVKALVHSIEPHRNSGLLMIDNDAERLIFNPKEVRLENASASRTEDPEGGPRPDDEHHRKTKYKKKVPALHVGDEVVFHHILAGKGGFRGKFRFAQEVVRTTTVKARNKAAMKTPDGRKFRKYVPLRFRLKKKPADGASRAERSDANADSPAGSGGAASSPSDPSSGQKLRLGEVFAKGPPQDQSVIGFTLKREESQPLF